MPQPVSYNPGTPVSGSIQENSISYVVDGQHRNYRGGFGGLSWMSEVPAENNVIFIGNSTSLVEDQLNTFILSLLIITVRQILFMLQYITRFT
jgi:hypothetical protein